MNYELELMNSNPFSFSTLSGTHSPLVAGSGSASILSASQNIDFPYYTKGAENNPFTLEVWFRPLTNTGEQVVMGHTGEGVLWNGTSFIVRVAQEAGPVEFTWTPRDIKAFHLVFSYSPGQVSFYVDGVLVGTLTVPTSPFSATATSIRVNGGTGTGVYDSLAFYTRALSGLEIYNHYTWGKSARSPVQTASANGGTTWNLMHSESDIYSTERFDAANWDLFFLNGVGVMSDRLTANEGGGTWMGMVPLSTMVGGVTSGVALNYSGLGVVLSYSTNGTTWTPVPNGAVILEDVDVANINLFVRIDLPDEGWVEYLDVSILNDRVLTPASGTRSLQYKSSALDHEKPSSLDYIESWGAVLRNGFLKVVQDSGTVGTIEMWAKIDDASGTLIDGLVTVSGGSYTFSSVTAYRNGQPVSNGAQPAGQWAHWVFVLNAPVASDITIGQNLDMNVGHLAVYPTQLTAAEALSLYRTNVGAPSLRINDESGITVTELAAPVKIYANNWSYVSSGN